MQQRKMAAPCRRMATRPVLQFVSCCSRAAVGNPACRPFHSGSVCGATLRTRSEAERATSPWTLMAAVCLQRLPVISADCTSMEQKLVELMTQLELENSILSDHELRQLEEAERMSRKQSDNYDSDEEDGRRDPDILLTRDLEDTWEQKLKNFQPAPRVRADVDEDLTSPRRCLADSLVLLAQQQVGAERLWLLPQTRWREGETLRGTAERALASLPAAAAAGLRATFLGNAPCGVYKYKLPRALRTESSVGTKVFFFRAVVPDGCASHLAAADASCLWLKRGELQRYLKPEYMKKVDRFVL